MVCLSRLAALSGRADQRQENSLHSSCGRVVVVASGMGATSQTKQKTRTANKDEGFEADNGEQDLETILKWRTNV